jgi:cellulose biosynthesis protein BcsQ
VNIFQIFGSLPGVATLEGMLPANWPITLLGAVIVGLLTLAGNALWRWLQPLPFLIRVFSSSRRLARAEKAVAEDSRGLWLTTSIKIEPPKDYEKRLRESIPIIAVANLKGGVGKTTTVANLMAHYGIKKNKRVLAIDFDFQGSLTSTVLSKADYDLLLAEQGDGSPSKAAQLVDGKSAFWLRSVLQAVQGVDKARCIPSYYSLSIMENRVMVEWLIGKRQKDIRYHLAETLLDDQIQKNFDIVLIDLPPRLTTASIQALCAATHVLIPTVLDAVSAEGAGGFVDQLTTNQDIWPHLRLLGVVGTMTDLLTCVGDVLRPSPLKDFEVEACVTANDTCRAALDLARKPLRDAFSSPIFPPECFIPQKLELSRAAGDRIAYASKGTSSNATALAEIRGAYDRLGDEIDLRLARKDLVKT